MTIPGREFRRLPSKDRAYVKRRRLRIPVYAQNGTIVDAYRVKNTRRMRKLFNTSLDTPHG